MARSFGRLGKEPLRSRFANIVWSWCENYYRDYKGTPKKNIIPIYEQWAKSNKDKDLHSTMERFLSSLSDEFDGDEDFNLDHALDLAQKHLNAVQLERLKESVQEKLDKGDVEGALQSQQGFTKIDLRSPMFIDLLSDSSVHETALNEKQKVLVKYPGAAGEFFGNEFSEDSFVAFMAPPKGAKSMVLLDIAWRAVLQGQKVAYFQVGDLSKNQITRRFQKRIVYRPLHPCTVQLPKGIMLSPGYRQLATVESEEKKYEKEVTLVTILAALEKIKKRTKGDFRVIHRPTKATTINDIRSILDTWDGNGFIAKVCVIDYADNLAAADFKASPIERTAYDWAMMRQISEARNCLVVTATQTNKEGFRSWILTRNNFSNSKMTLAHVTAFFGINSTEEERRSRIIRINAVERRESEFVESYCLYMGAYLAACNPCAVSCLPERNPDGATS